MELPEADAVLEPSEVDAVPELPEADAALELPEADAVLELPEADAVLELPGEAGYSGPLPAFGFCPVPEYGPAHRPLPASSHILGRTLRCPTKHFHILGIS